MSPGSKRLSKRYRMNASHLHRTVGEILYYSPVFKNAKVYQEYPVNRISSRFDSGREKFDWVILDPYKAVIECHGQQHYFPVRFGGIPEGEAKENYKKQVTRDKRKRKAAEEAGYSYVIIRYDEKPTTKMILKRIVKNVPINKTDEKIESKSPKQRFYKKVKERFKKWASKSGRADSVKKRQREYRKKQYEKIKNYRANKKITKTSD